MPHDSELLTYKNSQTRFTDEARLRKNICKRVIKDVLATKVLICETMIFNQGDHNDVLSPHHQATVLV